MVRSEAPSRAWTGVVPQASSRRTRALSPVAHHRTGARRSGSQTGCGGELVPYRLRRMSLCGVQCDPSALTVDPSRRAEGSLHRQQFPRAGGFPSGSDARPSRSAAHRCSASGCALRRGWVTGGVISSGSPHDSAEDSLEKTVLQRAKAHLHTRGPSSLILPVRVSSCVQ